jgi:hypothetical protein
MDPEPDVMPPTANIPPADAHAPPVGGVGGAVLQAEPPPPLNNNRSSISHNEYQSAGSGRSNPFDELPRARRSALLSGFSVHTARANPLRANPLSVILWISPSQEGGRSGFIYLSADKIGDQAALIPYFDNASRDVSVLPCPNFDDFLISNSLCTCQVSFITDLPAYILTLGRQIIEESAFSEEADPDLSWLPHSPLVTSASLLSREPTRPAFRLPYVMTQVQHPAQSTHLSSCPDPDGIDAPTVPVFFSMGGSSASVGNFSPLTTSDIYSLRGGSPQWGYILTQHSLATPQLPSSGASVLSSIAGFRVPALSDSSDSATEAPAIQPPVAPPPVIPTQAPHPAPAPAPTPSAAPISIKDKPSNMGIKPITDKDSWTGSEKIIDARLRRAPYWPGGSNELITTDANAAASVWWEEVIAFYCKPPVSDLFVEEHWFDGKGFEMIAHIDHHFNPSRAVDSLSYIFDLIDIKQLEQESVVSRDTASRVASTTSPAPAQGENPPPAPAQPTDSHSSSASIPGAITASTEQGSYDSGDEFDYEGKAEGMMYGSAGNSNAGYAYSHASCCNVTIDHPSRTDGHLSGDTRTTDLRHPSTASRLTREPQGINTIYHPKTVLTLLNNPPFPSTVHFQGSTNKRMSLLVADMGATNHMLPDKSAFILYYPVSGRRVRMGNSSFAPIVGHGTVVITLNGKKILIRECLHVLYLRNPLYSLRAHQRQRGCRFLACTG